MTLKTIKDKTQLFYVLLGHFLNQISNPAGSFPGSCIDMVVIISVAVSIPPEPVSAWPLLGTVLRVCGSSQV